MIHHRAPSFTLGHWESQSTEDSTTEAFYCFTASSQRKGAQRTVEPPPRPSLSPPRTPSCWEEQACGGLPSFEGWPLNSWPRSSLSSQLTLVCLQWIQLEPYSWVTSRGGVHVGGRVAFVRHIRALEVSASSAKTDIHMQGSTFLCRKDWSSEGQRKEHENMWGFLWGATALKKNFNQAFAFDFY